MPHTEILYIELNIHCKNSQYETKWSRQAVKTNLGFFHFLKKKILGPSNPKNETRAQRVSPAEK